MNSALGRIVAVQIISLLIVGCGGGSNGTSSADAGGSASTSTSTSPVSSDGISSVGSASSSGGSTSNSGSIGSSSSSGATAAPVASAVPIATAAPIATTAPVATAAPIATAAPVTTTDVLTYHNDMMRSGQTLTETTLTPANVNSASFGLVRLLSTDDPVDAAPLVASGLSVNGATHNVLYVATEHDSVYAFDADSGARLAQVSLLASGESPSDTRSCTQILPEIGITATPVIDRSAGPNGTLYVVAMSKDASGNYHQRLHALDLVSLADRLPAASITATYPGGGANGSNGVQSFDPKQYKERGALLLANGQIYTVWASHCDNEPYNGWIIAYNETSLAQSAVLDLTPNGTEAGIWNVAGLAADSAGALYALMANGTFDTTLNSSGLPNLGDYGNSAVKLAASAGSLGVVDYFTTDNTVAESDTDTDLGSGSPLVLPDQVDAMGATRHLLIGGGKDGNLLLLDRDSLGKFVAGSNPAYQLVSSALPGGLYSAAAYFNGSVYIANTGGTLKAFTLSLALLPATPNSQSGAIFDYPGTSPAISANGITNGIVWAVLSNTGAAAILHAYNPANLAQEYYNSAQATNGRDSFGNGEKYITPVIANGRVFVGTPSGVAVFGLL